MMFGEVGGFPGAIKRVKFYLLIVTEQFSSEEHKNLYLKKKKVFFRSILER